MSLESSGCAKRRPRRKVGPGRPPRLAGAGRTFDYEDYGFKYYAIDTKVNLLEATDQRKRRVGKPPTVKPDAPNLVSSWRSIVTRSDTLTEALETMNAALSMRLTHSRITEWEREGKAPSARVVNYMLATVVPALLVEQGLSEAKARELAGKVRVPGL